MTGIYLIGIIFVIFVAAALYYFAHEKSSQKTSQLAVPDTLDFNHQINYPGLEKFQTIFNQTIQQRNHWFMMFVSGLVTGQHCLLTGVPGSGKTFAVKTFAELSGLSLGRIQGTPDLMSGDLTGSEVFNQKTGEFEFKKGPLFNNIILVDEINRLGPKVLSGLIQAMAEGQISVGNVTYELPKPFLVIGTMNPYDQYGTYRLPQAISDRFGCVSYQTINDFDPSKSTTNKLNSLDIDWEDIGMRYKSAYQSLSLQELQQRWLELGVNQPTSRQLITMNDYYNFMKQFVGK